MPSFGEKPSLGEKLLQHGIVFLICVVFPGLTTMMAPASWLTFTRQADSVQCTARTCVFFVVPFRTQHVTEVTGVTHRERAGKTERKRKFGRSTDEYVHVDGEGFLQIQGAGTQMAEVSVSPASLDRVLEKTTAFLNANSPDSTTLFTIANWKFGGVMGGVLTMFTALYVVGYTLGFLNLLFQGFRKAMTQTQGR